MIIGYFSFFYIPSRDKKVESNLKSQVIKPSAMCIHVLSKQTVSLTESKTVCEKHVKTVGYLLSMLWNVNIIVKRLFKFVKSSSIDTTCSYKDVQMVTVLPTEDVPTLIHLLFGVNKLLYIKNFKVTLPQFFFQWGLLQTDSL